MSEIDEAGVLKEDLNDKLDVILEYVQDIPIIKADVKDLRVRMGRVEGRLDVIEFVVKDHTKTLGQHTRTLDHHTKTLGQHTAILDQHTAILARHTESLNEHSLILNRTTRTLFEHSQNLAEIKDSIKTHSHEIVVLKGN